MKQLKTTYGCAYEWEFNEMSTYNEYGSKGWCIDENHCFDKLEDANNFCLKSELLNASDGDLQEEGFYRLGLKKFTLEYTKDNDEILDTSIKDIEYVYIDAQKGDFKPDNFNGKSIPQRFYKELKKWWHDNE